MSKSTRMGVNTGLGNNNKSSDNKNFVLGSIGSRNLGARNALIARVRPDCPCFNEDNYPYIDKSISLTALYIDDDSTFDRMVSLVI